MLVVSQSTITEIAGFAEGRQVATESKGGLERDFQSPASSAGVGRHRWFKSRASNHRNRTSSSSRWIWS